MKNGILLCLLGTLLILSGCSSWHHPQAETFYNQAKGESPTQTLLALLDMMETSVQQAQSQTDFSNALDVLHNQFHATHRTFCDFSDPQRETPAYEQAVTLNKELKTIFHRLWEFKSNPTLRGSHLELFHFRLQEFRAVVQTIPL